MANSYALIGPKHDVTTTHGLENIDGGFPDPFYKRRQKISCPKVECSPDNCNCRCRLDNCNDKPVLPGPPSIVTMGLEDFREGKIMNFVDPFKGQHGYEVTEDGRVRNEDGSYTRYMHEPGWLAPIRREYLDGDAVVWTGEGYDPYRAANLTIRSDLTLRSDPGYYYLLPQPNARAARRVLYANATGYPIDETTERRQRLLVEAWQKNNRDLSGIATVEEYIKRLRRSRTWLLGAGTKDHLLFVNCADYKSLSKEGGPVYSRPNDETKKKRK